MIPTLVVSYAFIDKAFSLRTLERLWKSTVTPLYRGEAKKQRSPKTEHKSKNEKVTSTALEHHKTLSAKAEQDGTPKDSQDKLETNQPHEEAQSVPRFIQAVVATIVGFAQAFLAQMLIVSKPYSEECQEWRC